MTDPLGQLRAFVEDHDEETLLTSAKEVVQQRIKSLNNIAWEGQVKWELVTRWLANFDGKSGIAAETEQYHALYLLSQFLYFGDREIRVLLKAIYRDLFLIPLVQRVRTANGGSRKLTVIEGGVEDAISKTRFLGVGNPSESGPYLLYYFRQENGLSKTQFLDKSELIIEAGGTRQVRHSQIDHYVFVDDVCGSGETAKKYSDTFLAELKRLKPEVQLSYFAIFGTEEGMREVREKTVFGDAAAAVYELDSSYKCVSTASRYLKATPHGISPSTIQAVADFYGKLVWPDYARGYEGSELLLGFHHNTPDNTLPIIWSDPTHFSTIPWTAVFRRYPKV